MTAGSFLTGDGLVLFDVHDPDRAVAVAPDHERYRRLIVEREEPPEGAVARIEAALRRPG